MNFNEEINYLENVIIIRLNSIKNLLLKYIQKMEILFTKKKNPVINYI